MPRNPEDAHGAVLVGVFGICALLALRFQFRVLRLKGVGDVLEEDQAEYDVFVLGRIHVVAQRIGSSPELGFETEISRIGFPVFSCRCHVVLDVFDRL